MEDSRMVVNDSEMAVEDVEMLSLGSQRHKCSACYKQYKLKEHLIDHMNISYHSSHDPKCNVCKKHFKTLESVREHLTGPLAKTHCAEIFSRKGCSLCLEIFENSEALNAHKKLCLMVHVPTLCSEVSVYNDSNKSTHVFAIKCQMVGGGSRGSINLCARVCMVDESENVVFHSYVKHFIPVSNYRFELTGITKDHLENGLPLNEAKRIVEEILYHRQSPNRTEQYNILVGHELEHDLKCLYITYPDNFIRDTSKYKPLLKTNLVSFSLKYLVRTYLGYEIQAQAVHDPYEDCVAAMRLYKRMRSQFHQEEISRVPDSTIGEPESWMSPFSYSRLEKLMQMSPDQLLGISNPQYHCWCLDPPEPGLSA